MTREEQIFAYKELRKNGQAFFIDTYEDADRIIEALELTKGLSETNTSNPMYEIGYKKGASDMEQAKQIIIDKLQEQIPKWHLCSEELPNHKKYVLAVCVDCDNEIIMTYYDEEAECWVYDTTDGIESCEVIAWMELPKFERVE